MKYADILEAIQRSHPREDWEGVSLTRTEQPELFVNFYKPDVNLRFETTYRGADVQCEDFKDPWANNHPHPHATGYFYNLCYGATILRRFLLVSVDDGAARLPAPNPLNGKVERLDYHVARIHDTLGKLDDYIRRSGLQVAQ